MDNLFSLSDQTRTRLKRIVVVDHPDGTDIYGVDRDGVPVTERFKSFGNLPWGAVLQAALGQAEWSVREPGVQDYEPQTGFPRYTIPAIFN